ncbi:hypothetical protein EBA29_00175 [Bacillus velezensis]|nr:hypothetical protein EBA29_00175 [Bacillus velezensis]RUS00366.1 hypothetical protein EFW58_01425 [Bacillus velezensis]
MSMLDYIVCRGGDEYNKIRFKKMKKTLAKLNECMVYY